MERGRSLVKVPGEFKAYVKFDDKEDSELRRWLKWVRTVLNDVSTSGECVSVDNDDDDNNNNDGGFLMLSGRAQRRGR